MISPDDWEEFFEEFEEQQVIIEKFAKKLENGLDGPALAKEQHEAIEASKKLNAILQNALGDDEDEEKI